MKLNMTNFRLILLYGITIRCYIKNHWTNTRLVCTQINAIFMWNPNMVMKIGILKKIYVYDSSSALDSRSERVNNRDTINKCLMNVVSNPLDILKFSKYKQSDFNQSEHRNKVSLKCACIFNITLEINLLLPPHSKLRHGQNRYGKSYRSR